MIAFEKSVGAVVFRRRGDNLMYLLLNYRGGHWSFPKGHLEAGESDEETLRREVVEETGIKDLKIIPSFKQHNRYFYRAKDDEKVERKKSGKATNIFKKVVFYLAETKTENVKISFEHSDYDWLSYEQALERTTYRNSKNVLKKAQEFLEKLS